MFSAQTRVCSVPINCANKFHPIQVSLIADRVTVYCESFSHCPRLLTCMGVTETFSVSCFLHSLLSSSPFKYRTVFVPMERQRRGRQGSLFRISPAALLSLGNEVDANSGSPLVDQPALISPNPGCTQASLLICWILSKQENLLKRG